LGVLEGLRSLELVLSVPCGCTEYLWRDGSLYAACMYGVHENTSCDMLSFFEPLPNVPGFADTGRSNVRYLPGTYVGDDG
jgi:hypothetical protein